MVLSFSKMVLLKQDNNCLTFEQIKEINHTKLTTLKDTEEYLEGSTDCRLCVWVGARFLFLWSAKETRTWC